MLLALYVFSLHVCAALNDTRVFIYFMRRWCFCMPCWCCWLDKKNSFLNVLMISACILLYIFFSLPVYFRSWHELSTPCATHSLFDESSLKCTFCVAWKHPWAIQLPKVVKGNRSGTDFFSLLVCVASTTHHKRSQNRKNGFFVYKRSGFHKKATYAYI